MTEFRLNVLVLALVGAAVVIALAVILPGASTELAWGVGGALIGAFGGVMKDLVQPGVVPDHVVLALLEQQSEGDQEE